MKTAIIFHYIGFSHILRFIKDMLYLMYPAAGKTFSKSQQTFVDLVQIDTFCLYFCSRNRTVISKPLGNITRLPKIMHKQRYNRTSVLL